MQYSHWLHRVRGFRPTPALSRKGIDVLTRERAGTPCRATFAMRRRSFYTYALTGLLSVLWAALFRANLSIAKLTTEAGSCSVVISDSDGSTAGRASCGAADASAALDVEYGLTMPRPVVIPAGDASLGTDEPHFPADAEGPAFAFSMPTGIRIDAVEVPNFRFAEFVRETEHITEAERYGWSFVHEDALSPAVRAQISQSVQGAAWWVPVPNATWRSPEGVGSDLQGRAAHPVVHVSLRDAARFCGWAGGRLPSEDEWEYAARGGKRDRLYPWGNALLTGSPPTRHRANLWQGRFPHNNTADDGVVWTAPVTAFGPQNAFGLYGMVGNVWEWTSSPWCGKRLEGSPVQRAARRAGLDWRPSERSVDGADCNRLNTAARKKQAEDVGEIDYVKKGGSFMCHEATCYRYRVAARHKNSINSSAYNLGFRCVYDAHATNTITVS